MRVVIHVPCFCLGEKMGRAINCIIRLEEVRHGNIGVEIMGRGGRDLPPLTLFFLPSRDLGVRWPADGEWGRDARAHMHTDLPAS